MSHVSRVVMSTAAAAMLVQVGAGACARGGRAELQSGDRVKVVKVIKGDEVDVEKDRKLARLRLLGIYAFASVVEDPLLDKLRTPAAVEVADRLLGQVVEVTLGDPPVDQSQRYLAYVSFKGGDVARGLVEAGLAVVYTEYPFERQDEYLAAEASARAASRGVWAEPGAAQLLSGLRREWRAERVKRGDAPAPDPLAVEAAP